MRILTTVHLSDIQKEVLAKVKAAPNSHMAYGTLQQTEDNMDSNFASARDVLAKLGVLLVGDGTIEVTEKGDQLATKENITDEMGELTELGDQLANTNRQNVQPSPTQSTNVGDGMGDESGFPTESFNLIKSLNVSAGILSDQDKLKN